MKCDLVVPVVPMAVPVSSEAGDEELRDSKNVSHLLKAVKSICTADLIEGTSQESSISRSCRKSSTIG